MRNYNSVQENAQTIAQEVINSGRSIGWFIGSKSEQAIAAKLESELAKYNIGYVNAANGEWAYRVRGTRYFTVSKFLEKTKHGVNSLIDSLKK